MIGRFDLTKFSHVMSSSTSPSDNLTSAPLSLCIVVALSERD